jgi:hypothetical protein
VNAWILKVKQSWSWWGVHRFSTNLGATSKFQSPEGWYNTRCYHTKLAHTDDLSPGICAPLVVTTILQKFSRLTFKAHNVSETPSASVFRWNEEVRERILSGTLRKRTDWSYLLITDPSDQVLPSHLPPKDRGRSRLQNTVRVSDLDNRQCSKFRSRLRVYVIVRVF